MLEASYAGAVEAENVFDRVTHIIVYRNEGQQIPEKNILRRYNIPDLIRSRSLCMYAKFLMKEKIPVFKDLVILF